MLKVLPKPSANEVKKYLKKRENLERYMAQDSAVCKIFSILPENKLLDDVLIKASILNDFYSTNIIDIYNAVKHIPQIQNIDQRLTEGDLSLVAEIAKAGEQARNNYSFATKYCSHHNPDKFPIYDSFVDEALWYFKEQYSFSEFTRTDLKNYSEFERILKDFQQYFGLTEFKLRELDTYLWLLGKEGSMENETDEDEFYSEAEHLDKALPDIQALYENYKQAIIATAEGVETAARKHYISFKLGKKRILSMVVYRTKLEICISVPKEEVLNDPEGIMKSTPTSGLGNWAIPVTDSHNMGYVLGIIRQILKIKA